MADAKRSNWRVERNARVEVLASGSGFILVVGPAFFWLDREATEDLVCLLADALEAGDPLTAHPRDAN